MTAAAEGATYVPDGDPCPKPGHGGQPTRLLRLPGFGLYSQCAGCVDDFFAWYGSAARDVRPRATSENPIAKPEHPQLELIA